MCSYLYTRMSVGCTMTVENCWIYNIIYNYDPYSMVHALCIICIYLMVVVHFMRMRTVDDYMGISSKCSAVPCYRLCSF